MSKFLAQLGLQVGGALAGKALGIGSDARQVKQQEKLTRVQEEANKRMAKYNHELGMKSWEETNYPAQVEQLKKAGLNPALMYGQGGGGGTTTGNAGGGGVSGGTAEGASAGVGMAMQLASQMALMKAQKENIEADTENKKAQTGKTGVETETAKGTQEAEIEKAKTEAQTAVEEMWLRTNERTVSDHTIKQRVEMTMQELLGQIAKNKNTDADTRNKQAQAIISEFDAKMTEEGISTRAPWYLKMVTDLLEKVGLNPITATKEALK